MFLNIPLKEKKKKTRSLILGCSWVSGRYEGVLSACPSVQEHREKGFSPESLVPILPEVKGRGGGSQDHGCILRNSDYFFA